MQKKYGNKLKVCRSLFRVTSSGKFQDLNQYISLYICHVCSRFIQILLILVLFLGVSLAEEVPGLFRDKSVPDKLGLSPRKKYKARDQHKRFVNIVDRC